MKYNNNQFPNKIRNTLGVVALGLSLYSSYGFAQKMPPTEPTLQEGEVLIEGRDYGHVREKIAFKGKLTEYPKSLIVTMNNVKSEINLGRTILEDTLKKGEITPKEAKNVLDRFESAFRSYSKFKGMYFYTLYMYPEGGIRKNEVSGEVETNRFQREVDYITEDIIRVVDVKTGDVTASPEKEIREFGVFANKMGLISHKTGNNDFSGSLNPNKGLESVIDVLQNVVRKDTPLKYSFNRYVVDLLSDSKTGESIDEYIYPDNFSNGFSEFMCITLPILGLLGFGIYRLVKEDEKKDNQEKEKPKDEPEEIKVEQLIDVWGLSQNTNKTESKIDAPNIWAIGKIK